MNNGFGTLLILVERIKIDIAQAWEGLQRITDRDWKKRMNWYDNEGRDILNEPPYEFNMNEEKGWITGKNSRTNEDTWGNLDTSEHRDPELIR